MSSRNEKAFETTIEAHLLSEAGYHRGDPKDYDPNLALLPNELIAYIEATQPKKWAALANIYPNNRRQKLLEDFDRATADLGLLAVLRRGFYCGSKHLRVVTFRPPNSLNPSVQADYDANRLVVVRQLHHDPKHPERSLDLVLFVNGIPVVTAELKNPLTGQQARHAQSQYRTDRSGDTPIFRFKRRALVNFAVDPDLAYMTSRLEGEDTRFWPFNRGVGTGAGNPIIEDKHKTSYLWEQVWQRDSLLELLERFIHVRKDKQSQREDMIFPRYHQLDCVRQLEGEALRHGAGRNYLIQHSTGSGKSNTIAWLAHRLAYLCDAQDNKVYDCVVVISDRRILDQQLQATIAQLPHTPGEIKTIDEDSTQLARALAEGVPIIITTLQKFGFVADKIGQLPDRRYAVIVDEAHSSQNGEMRNNLKQLLGESSELAREAEELGDEEDVDASQDVLRAALARGPRSNISFFAFTATPKYKTLRAFGLQGADGKYVPCHVYSMRQAIDEGYILDVLQSYTSYQRYFELIKLVEEDPQLDKRQGARALARLVSAHPKDIESKVAIIVEHFVEHVKPLLGGRAKGMVVTGSRLEAVRFRLAFDRYVKAKGHDLRALVAFTGSVTDPDDPASIEKPYTEPSMNLSYWSNQPIEESALAKEFGRDGYQLLIVANKYQTGFDQPLLCAMYVNKKLVGVQAVQTLSRLNRPYPNKQTFVLDFLNQRDEVLKAYARYYDRTSTADDVNPGELYTLYDQLLSADVLRHDELNRFAALVLEGNPANHGPLYGMLNVVEGRLAALDEDDGKRFVERFEAYCRIYSFLAQVVRLESGELEVLYLFGKELAAKLRAQRDPGAPKVDLKQLVGLRYHTLAKVGDGAVSVAGDASTDLRAPSMVAGPRTPPQQEALSNLIHSMNTRYATDFDELKDVVEDINGALVEDPQLRQAAQSNDEDNFAHKFGPRLEAELMDRIDKHALVEQLLADEEMLAHFSAQMRKHFYQQLRSE